MARTIRYGMLGARTVEVDDDGFIEVPVIIQDSGLYAGAPPPELRIHCMGGHGEDKTNRAYVAKLNRHTDLPFYLASAKIKVVGKMEKVTDEDLRLLGIQPFPED